MRMIKRWWIKRLIVKRKEDRKLFDNMLRSCSFTPQNTSKVDIPSSIEVAHPKKKKVHSLKIYWGNESNDWTGFSNNDSKYDTALRHYIHFYRWFYLRTSPAYTKVYSKGATIYLRDQIKRVEFITEEKEE